MIVFFQIKMKTFLVAFKLYIITLKSFYDSLFIWSLQLSEKYFPGKKAHIDVIAIIALKLLLTSLLWMQSAMKKTHYPLKLLVII